jgi:hypothetical protein
LEVLNAVTIPSVPILPNRSGQGSGKRMFLVKLVTFSAMAGGIYLDASLLFGWH